MNTVKYLVSAPPPPPMLDFDPKVGGGRLQGTTPLHGGSPSYINRQICR